MNPVVLALKIVFWSVQVVRAVRGCLQDRVQGSIMGRLNLRWIFKAYIGSKGWEVNLEVGNQIPQPTLPPLDKQS